MNPGENKEFDKQLREKFEGFRPEAPNGLWDKIATQLDAEESRFIVSTRVKPRRFPTWWMAVAATLLIVCSVLYWQNRPVSVTYLHAHVDTAKEPEKAVVEPITPAEAPETVAEPLDLERLRRLFAKRNGKGKVEARPQVETHERQVEEVAREEDVERQQLATSESKALSFDEPSRLRDSLEREKAEIASVPAIEPLVVLEEEETMLASTEQTKQPFGLSNILNYVVGTVDQRDEKLVTFSNDEEGSLKLDFNFGLAKNRKKKLK